jgi:hypothetical protein
VQLNAARARAKVGYNFAVTRTAFPPRFERIKYLFLLALFLKKAVSPLVFYGRLTPHGATMVM